jgi:hypothetical protein
MNPVFPKLPRNYAADEAWSRIFFEKNTGNGVIGDFRGSWNIETAENARV